MKFLDFKIFKNKMLQNVLQKTWHFKFFFSPFPPIAFFRATSLHFTPILTVFVVVVVRANYVPAHISHSFVPFTRLWIRANTCFILIFFFILHLHSLCIHSHAGARAHGKMKNEKNLYSIVMLFYYIVLCSII